MLKKTVVSFLLFISIHIVAQEFVIDSLRNNMSEIQQFLFTQQHDTSYITNYNDKLALKLITNTKLNFFQIKDQTTDESVLYRPNRGLNFGIGASYRWFALDLVFNSKINQDTDLGDNRFLDFQGRVYSNKHFIEAKLQYYDGYKMDRVNGYTPPSYLSDVRNDIRTVNIGMQYLFAFNYERFSFKAPFVLSEVQRQSAGSLIGGIGFNMFVVNADSSLVPSAELPNANSSLMFDDMLVMDLSLKLGYMYSFVVKENYFLSLGAIPGLGYAAGDFKTDSRQRITPQITWNLKALATIGYNDRRVFSGLQFIADANSVKQDLDARTVIGTGKVSVFVGYRFDVNKKRKK